MLLLIVALVLMPSLLPTLLVLVRLLVLARTTHPSIWTG
jgi:hypothetical protein